MERSFLQGIAKHWNTWVDRRAVCHPRFWEQANEVGHSKTVLAKACRRKNFITKIC